MEVRPSEFLLDKKNGQELCCSLYPPAMALHGLSKLIRMNYPTIITNEWYSSEDRVYHEPNKGFRNPTPVTIL